MIRNGALVSQKPVLLPEPVSFPAPVFPQAGLAHLAAHPAVGAR